MNKVAIYLRISVDELTDKESKSILNQRLYIKQYLEQNNLIENFSVEEYIDDGYSGTNQNRPSFQKLLKDIKNKNISCIIVKDFSRFMRDYIELGNYLENIFPFLGIRFISINDNYDSLNNNEFQNSVDIRFKTLLYDFYSKDISNKVKLTFNKLKREGKFLSWSPPYGYIKDPNNKHRIIIDKETCETVKRIFEMANENKSSRDIAKILNSENVITPSNRKKEITSMDYSYLKVFGKNHKDSIWRHDNVLDILHNEIYIGTYVFNKFVKTSIGSNHKKRIKEEDWKRILDNHEPIITKELFNSVQQKLKHKRSKYKSEKKSSESNQKSVLQGFVKCSECNHCLRYTISKKRYQYFKCDTCKLKGMKTNISKVKDIENKLISILNTIFNNHEKSNFYSYNYLCDKINNLKLQKREYFKNYKLNLISKDEFIKFRDNIDFKIQEMKIAINDVQFKNTKKNKFNILTKGFLTENIEYVLVNNNEVLEVKLKKIEC
ncbi:MAG TPA: recombinase family protein [Candidatus Dwaynia gallinarum]|nr:recombinase family protein [Candidatus Dwaynia gallinarum]